MTASVVPGVRISHRFRRPPRTFLTGVPAFLGRVGGAIGASGAAGATGAAGAGAGLDAATPVRLEYGDPVIGTLTGQVGDAVRGFFGNGGRTCYVVPLQPSTSARTTRLAKALAATAELDDIDLVCAPDLMSAGSAGSAESAESAESSGPSRPSGPSGGYDLAAVTRQQRAILAHCRERGDRFAILDAVPGPADAVLSQVTALTGRDGGYGALYHPWLSTDGAAWLPPCGHVAGVYAACDRRVGPHKAPANEPLDGVVNLRAPLSDDTVAALYPQGVNCVRALPGMGIRVWGARTMAADPAWRDVTARRLVMTLARWIESYFAELAFEPNDPRLWLRITREVTAYLDGLFARGALKGDTAADAFFVQCDGATNTLTTIELGQVHTRIGIALNRPAEFIEVRVLHGTSGSPSTRHDITLRRF